MRFKEIDKIFNQSILGLQTPRLIINPKDEARLRDWFISTMDWLTEKQREIRRKEITKEMSFKGVTIEYDSLVKENHIVIKTPNESNEVQLFED
jgi:hypothetical protein